MTVLYLTQMKFIALLITILFFVVKCDGYLRGDATEFVSDSHDVLTKKFEVFLEKRPVHSINDHKNRILSVVSCYTNQSEIGTVTPSCSNRGVCMSNGQCYCAPHYTTYPKDSNVGCDYKRKSRLAAFAWHLFFGLETGAGEWYLGNTDYATFEVVLFFPAIIGFTCVFGLFGCCLDILKQDNENRCSHFCIFIGVILGVLSVLSMFGFWGFELYSIATGERLDHNGVRTY